MVNRARALATPPARAGASTVGPDAVLETDALSEFVGDAILEVSTDGRILSWSGPAAALYGWSASEAIGADLEHLLSPPSYEPHAAAYARLATTGRWTGRLQRRTSAGDLRVVRIAWTVRLDQDGGVAGFVEVSREDETDDEIDILTASEERYRQLFCRAPVALMLDDPSMLAGLLSELEGVPPEGIDDYLDANPAFLEGAIDRISLVEVNDQAVHLFGAHDHDELLGPVRHIWADNPRSFRNAFVAHFRGEAHFSEETRIRTLDGRTVDVLFSLTFPVQDDLKKHNLNGMRDITARREAEARLRKVSADFTHAARLSTLGELTTSIGHEVKQPLSAILTYAQTSLRWLGKAAPDVDKARALAIRIVEQAQRASDIIERIQYLAGKREPRRDWVDVNDAIRECLVFIRHESDDKRVQLTVDLDPAAPAIFADRIQIQQVVVNLIVNAIQALKVTDPRRREVRLSTRDLAANGIALTVTDTGPGIPDADLEKVFESFITTKIGGMGIGLAVCRSIVTAHGGAITASRGDDGGARFQVTLPLSGEPISTGEGS